MVVELRNDSIVRACLESCDDELNLVLTEVTSFAFFKLCLELRLQFMPYRNLIVYAQPEASCLLTLIFIN